MSRTLEQHLEDSGLKGLSNKLITLQELGDNNILYGYESSLSVIRPVTDVSVNDICVSGNFIGVVIEIYAQEVKTNDLGLSGIKVRYDNPSAMVREGQEKRYTDKVFVFDGNLELLGSRVDTSIVSVVDYSSIKIIKRDGSNYKNEISKLEDRYNSSRR